jgi:hypothetical protein
MPGKDINHGFSEIIIGKPEKNFNHIKKRPKIHPGRFWKDMNSSFRVDFFQGFKLFLYTTQISCRISFFLALPKSGVYVNLKFGGIEILLGVLTQYETVGCCRLGLNRPKFYWSKIWDIMQQIQ